MVSKRYIVRRILEIVPVILSIVIINFVILHMAPGDVALFLSGEEATTEYVETLREEYGLNKPLHEQFIIYLTQLLRGNLGYSWVYKRPVLSIISDRLPNTVLLMGLSAIVVIGIGVILGVVAARTYPSRTEKFISWLSLLLYSLPIYWFGIMMILFFSIYLKWFPMYGMRTVGVEMTPMGKIFDLLWHLFLPVVSLSIVWFGSYVRITKTSIIEVMREDYITTARAIGYDKKTVFNHHALRNALLPVVTRIGLHLGFIVSGAVITETIFAWPGMGRLVYFALTARDYPMIIGTYIVMSIVVSLAVLLTDVAYLYLDPRVSYEE